VTDLPLKTQEPRLWRSDGWTAQVIKNEDDGSAFITLVKTAREFVRRSEQQLHATLHQSITVAHDAGRITVCLDITPDDDNPSALLSAKDELDELLAEVRVSPAFKLNRASALKWVEAGFAKPV